MEIKRSLVAYCRVSTLEQKRKGYGIDIQIRDLTLFAERQELFIERFYKDEAESGVAADRKALRRLRRDCGRGSRPRCGCTSSLSRDPNSRPSQPNITRRPCPWPIAHPP